MRVYEASVELGPQFDDRRVMFSARAAGDIATYENYKILEDGLIGVVLNALTLTGAEEIEIFYREFFDDQSELFSCFSSDGLITNDIFNKTIFSGDDEIKEVLRYLCRDLGFITLGQAGKILIIPAERLGFILCIPDELEITKPGVIEIDNSQIAEYIEICSSDGVQLP